MTALIVLDVTTQTCDPQPKCTAVVPRIAALLAKRAQREGVRGVQHPGAVPPILGLGRGCSFDTPLDEPLRARGISDAILVGWRADGSVLYTSVGVTPRTSTVGVPVDGTAGVQDNDLAVGWLR